MLTLASLKMYKTRIKQWRLDKKNKESDMKAIVRKRAKRLSEGKASAFHVRGRPVDFEEVIRYWGRKGISIEDIVAQRAASATPVDVDCLTPLVSRVASPVLAPMTTPGALAIPEQTLILIQDYIRGSFESGAWERNFPRNLCYSIKDNGNIWVDMNTMRDSCVLACDLFSQRLFQEAGVTLIRGTAAIKQIVLCEDPHTLSYLLSILRNFLLNGRHEIDLAILRHFSCMGELLLGERNPLPRICQWLASHEQMILQHALETCSRMIVDVFADILGPLHRSTLNVSSDYSWILSISDHAQATTRLKTLLAECQSNFKHNDHRIVEARGMLMDQSFFEGDDAEAERHAWIILACADEIEDAEASKEYRVQSLEVLAKCHFYAGKIESAITKLNQALELHGVNDSQARIWLWDLENWHSQQGNIDAAIEARNKRLAILEAQKASEVI